VIAEKDFNYRGLIRECAKIIFTTGRRQEEERYKSCTPLAHLDYEPISQWLPLWAKI
jgi:hypothetical protein